MRRPKPACSLLTTAFMPAMVAACEGQPAAWWNTQIERIEVAIESAPEREKKHLRERQEETQEKAGLLGVPLD